MRREREKKGHERVRAATSILQWGEDNIGTGGWGLYFRERLKGKCIDMSI